MGRPAIDLTGQIFGTLFVLERAPSIKEPCGKISTMWKCQCLNCGKIYIVRGSVLKRMKSCGCLNKSLITPEDKYIQGVWKGILSRCRNPNNKEYKNYGGRGISVCSEWLHFRNFQKWCHENGYAIGLTIDRIDTNGNYEPMNCRFATQKEQQRNRRNNTKLCDPFDGETMCMAALAEKYEINYTRFCALLNKYKMPIEDAINKLTRKDVMHPE